MIKERHFKIGKLPLCLALILSACVVVLTGIIPAWGKWYSSHLLLRWQTERILEGHFGLSSVPSAMAWDLAWGNGAVQQVWGVGIPFWRLPFEVIAKGFGQPAFPDIFAFVIALTVASYFLSRFHLENFKHVACGLRNGFGLLGLYATVLFPAFLALCSSRFLVYEEIVAYGFLFGLLLMAGTAWLWIRPAPASYYGLALMSGLITFIRPTLGVYGVASLILGSVAMVRNTRRYRLVFFGGMLYVFIIGLLLCLNTVRFGSCFEFGYSLNVNSINAMVYAQRFGNPFHNESLISAAKELFGLLFMTRSVVGKPPYGFDLYPGQSHAFRWKEIYFSTYDVSVLIMLIAVWLWLAWRLISRLRRREGLLNLDLLEVVGLWSVLATIPLTVFYLWFPFISSRYLLDYGPAFAATCWVFFAVLLRLTDVKSRFGSTYARFGVMALIVGWWGYETLTIINRSIIYLTYRIGYGSVGA